MRLHVNPPAYVTELIRVFEQAGYELYAVGGVVRDILLERPLGDWDFTTNATPEQVVALIPDSFYDNDFGMVGIKTEAEPIHVTTFRTESGYTDGRHPDHVSWGKSLAEDLSRRDFTINAMALRPVGINQFELIDLFQGQQDIAQRTIRTVGTAHDRFNEDALRMMRAVRIAAQLQFAIEERTFAAISANAELLKRIAWERIRDELLKLLASDYPADGYLLLKNTGLAAYVLPEMEAAFGVEQKSPGRHHIYDVGTHSVESLRHCPSNDPITRLATLIHDVGKVKTQRVYPDGRITFYNHEMESAKAAERIADRLRLSKQQKDKLVRLVRWHQFTVDEHQTDSALRRFIRNVGIDNLADMLALRTGDRLGGGARETSWRLEDFKRRLVAVQQTPFGIADLKISGIEVMQHKGIGPGPKVGQYLQMLFDEVDQGKLMNEREALLERLGSLTPPPPSS